MRKILKNIASLILVSIMAFFTLTSCGTKLAELFKMETFNYSYEKLSDGLLRIDYVNVTKWYEEDGPKYEHKVYKTLSAEEQERVLREMNERDTADSTREIAPTQAAADAVLLDNTGMSADESVGAVIDLILKKTGGKKL